MSVGAVDAGPADVAGAAPGVAAVAPVSPPQGMPDMPGMPPAPPVIIGPKGPHWDPTGTVPVAGSPADPAHPAQQAAPAPAPAAVMPASAEEAARRRYTADQEVAAVDDQQAANAADAAKVDETNKAKQAELLKAQAAEQAATDARQQAGIERATAERDRLQQDAKDFRFHNFWDDKSTGQKILAGVGVILGSASYSREHVNQAAKSIDDAVAQEWSQQKADLDRRFELVKQKSADVRDLQSQYDTESGKLKLRQELQLKALASELDALASRSRNQNGVLMAQKVAAEARALAEQHGQQGIADIAKAHSEALKDAETQSQIDLNKAKLGKLKRAGAGGPGADAAFAQFVDAAGQLKPGQPIPSDVARLAHKAGFKLDQIADAVNKYRNSGSVAATDAAKAAAAGGNGGMTAAQAAKLAASNDANTVRVGGKPIGLVPSGRGGAVAYQKLLTGYQDSIESMEQLLKHIENNPIRGRLTIGNDAYNRAVLALQATSTANATDTTTKHEAATLKGIATLNPDAIRTSLEHLKERQKEYISDLRPLPAASAAAAPATTKLQMPDGSIAEFDASGKRIK